MPTVVVADDHPHIRLLVSVALESDQYRIVEATDGDEALRAIEREHPPLAILDVAMPGLSGLEVVRAVRANPDLADTYVILLTAHSQATDVKAGLAAGANEYLTKPFSPLELIEIVERVLEVGAN